MGPGQGERRATEKKRHVAAQLRGELEQLVPWNRVTRQTIDSDQRRRSVAGASSETRAGRNALGEGEMHSEAFADGAEHGGCASHREVLRRRADVGAFHPDGDLV